MLDEVADDQEVRRETHFEDDADLVIGTLEVVLRRTVREPPVQTARDLLAQPRTFGFTVGQRRGLGIDRSRLDGEPRYVVDVDAPTNRVVIGTAELLGVRQITGEHARWCGPAPIGTIRAGAQVRAHGEEVGCAAYQGPGGELEVTLDAPIRGVAPGQSVVLYDGTRVIGSATISSTRAHPQSR